MYRRALVLAAACALGTLLTPLPTPRSAAHAVHAPARGPSQLPLRPAAALEQTAPCRGCPVVLISVDTLRADHLGCYGYQRNTSANIDRFATTSVRFAQAYATSYVTADSHMSMFTSLYPSVHGVRNANGGVIVPLASNIRTLGEMFADAGYATAAVTGGGNMSGEFGFARGMQSYQVIEPPEQSVDAALRFARAHRNEPFFLFWHNYHVHDPYLPRRPIREWLPTAYRGAIETRRSKLAPTSDLSFAQWRNAYWRRVDRNEPEDIAYLKGLYDSEIREMDAALGRLFAGLRRVAPNAVIVLTSDHGEQFGEHGGFLHNDLYEELLRVPLLLSYPGMQAGLSIPTPVSLIDLAPTLVELVGLEAAAQFQGASLLGVVNGKRDATPIFSEKAGVRHSLVLEGVKTIQRQRKVEVYDLFRDPSELLPLGDRDPRARNVATELARTLDTNQRARQRLEVTTDAQPQPGALPSRAIEQLRALGYAQ